MSAPDPVLRATRPIVERVAGPGRIPANVGPETRLSEGGFWLDSVELLEVVLACETEFGIVFDAGRDLTPDALETLGTLAALVRANRSRVGSGT